MVDLSSPTVAILGCGTLGTAIAAGILDPANGTDYNIKQLITTTGTESSKQRVEDALCAHSSRLTALLKSENLRAIQESDVVVLAFKPIKRHEVFSVPGVSEALHGKVVLSIMAGISIAELRRSTFGDQDASSEQAWAFQAIRVMPNMAAKIRQALSLFTGNFDTLSKEAVDFASWVFSQVGEVRQVPESSFDIYAVLVGCAGSLLLLAIDGLLDAAVAEGVGRSEVQNMVVNSAIGMMKLVPAGDHPSVLREKIASPGGCSIRALLELEKQGVRSAFTSAILAAAEQSKNMS
ncbi:pyrroline-5-carboxylate reductase dimerization-domain-containing protein [Diaporthe sp. PMI_573]|nr:pyrroline-5-carboxylate reductase dimerization-domain-containing protein [Diaporthaceae sp. PMI_573]